MKTLTRSFGQGLLLVAPIGITAWIIWAVVTKLDEWLGTSIPGLGVVVAFFGIAAIGYATRNVIGFRAVRLVEGVMQRVPIVKLLYGSLRDLFGAFVGDRRGFEHPVVVDIDGKGFKVMGFMTCEAFDDPQLADHVSVYLPESYNFAGNLIVVPRERVRELDADGAEFMAFIISGGVTTMRAAKTALDRPALG